MHEPLAHTDTGSSGAAERTDLRSRQGEQVPRDRLRSQMGRFVRAHRWCSGSHSRLSSQTDLQCQKEAAACGTHTLVLHSAGFSELLINRREGELQLQELPPSLSCTNASIPESSTHLVQAVRCQFRSDLIFPSTGCKDSERCYMNVKGTELQKQEIRYQKDKERKRAPVFESVCVCFIPLSYF